MGEFHCDRCQKSLLVIENVRYKVRIQVESVYDIMEISPEDIKNNAQNQSYKEILDAIENKTAEELEAEIYKSFEFDLCLACQREYILNPLAAPNQKPEAFPDEA
jgi:hypothetical protein